MAKYVFTSSLIKSWLHISLLTFITLSFHISLLVFCSLPTSKFFNFHTVHLRYRIKSLQLSKLLLQSLRLNVGFKADTHYPYIQAVNTGRISGCQKYARMYGPYIRPVYTGRIYG